MNYSTDSPHPPARSPNRWEKESLMAGMCEWKSPRENVHPPGAGMSPIQRANTFKPRVHS
jgi:hypothetical protein